MRPSSNAPVPYLDSESTARANSDMTPGKTPSANDLRPYLMAAFDNAMPEGSTITLPPANTCGGNLVVMRYAEPGTMGTGYRAPW